MSKGHGFPSETIHTHAFELQAHRKSTAGRALVPLTLLKSNDRAEVEAEHARRSETNSQLRNPSRLVIVENKRWRDDGVSGP
jgi:hypothetical protein